jgi:hypothetical protein
LPAATPDRATDFFGLKVGVSWFCVVMCGLLT